MTAVWIVAIAVGIPVISGTATRIAKLYYADKQKSQELRSSEEFEALGDIQKEVSDLKRRVENLESILLDLDKRV